MCTIVFSLKVLNLCFVFLKSSHSDESQIYPALCSTCILSAQKAFNSARKRTKLRLLNIWWQGDFLVITVIVVEATHQIKFENMEFISYIVAPLLF